MPVPTFLETDDRHRWLFAHFDKHQCEWAAALAVRWWVVNVRRGWVELRVASA